MPGPRHGLPRRVAALIGPELGWDAARIAGEADRYATALLAELTRAGLDAAGDPDPGPAPVGAPGVTAG